MRAEKVVYTLLSQATAVTALVGNRIHPVRLPQNCQLPAAVYELVSSVDTPPIHAAAGGGITRSRVQVTVLARSYSQVKAVHEAMRKALLYQSGQIAGVQVNAVLRDVVGPDMRDDDTDQYLQSVDYLLLHDEAL